VCFRVTDVNVCVGASLEVLTVCCRVVTETLPVGLGQRGHEQGSNPPELPLLCHVSVRGALVERRRQRSVLGGGGGGGVARYASGEC